MTTIESAPATAPVIERGRIRVRTVVRAIVAGVALAAMVGLAALIAYDRAYDGRILPGVRVGSVDLSGLDRAAAEARLDAALGGLASGTVILADGVSTETVGYGALHRRADVGAMVDAAISVSRSGNPIDRVVDEVRTAIDGADIPVVVTVDRGTVERFVRAIAARDDRPAVNASAMAYGTGFSTTPSAPGRAIDVASAADAISRALLDPDAPSVVHVGLTTTPVAPTVTDAAAVAARAQAAAVAQDLVVTAGTASWTLPGATIHGWITFGTTPSGYGPLVTVPDLTAALKPFVAKVARPPKDASFLVDRSGQVVGATAAVVGQSLDVPATVAVIAWTLDARAAGAPPPGGTAPAAITETQPRVSTAVAAQSAPLMRKISTWTTYYVPGPPNGYGANISIPARTISGTVVAPGQWFSFWKTVGEVTAAKGYTYGGAIIDGRSVEGKTIGGGICSTSTTLFNAALRAGFEMGARENHYYYISRYPVGLDATVFINDAGLAQDMTWRNDTPYPVLIQARTSAGVVTFDLYSVPSGRTVTLTKPIVKNYQPSTTVTEPTTTIPPGTTEQVEWEAAGFDAWVTRVVKDASGAVVHDDTFYSHYARVVGIILVGTKPAG